MKAKLVLLSGPKKEVFKLNSGAYIVGRDDFSDITIHNDSVSRQHCLIKSDNGHYVIKDLKSTNGTFVNGRRIAEKDLNVGDEITVGTCRLLFTITQTHEEDVKIEVIQFFDENARATHDIVELPVKKDAADLIDTNLRQAKALTDAKALRDLVTLYRLGNVIHSIQDRAKLLETILDMTFNVVEADVAMLLLLDKETHDLKPKAFRSRTKDSRTGTLAISRTLAQQVLEEGKAVLITDALTDKRFSARASIIHQGIKSAICAPLKGTSKTIGLLYVDSHSNEAAFSEEDLRLITAISIQASIALENSILFEEKKDLLLGSIRALIASTEARDPYTHGHSVRVASMCLAIAREMNLDEEIISTIELAALLHDTGKLGLPDTILRKNGALTNEEFELVKEHSVKGEQIIKNIKGIEEIAKTVRHHHEWFNGAGYPDRLAGKEIPLASRMISIADTFDAMSSNRPYRDALALNEALLEIERNAGRQFDERLVNLFLAIIIQGKLSQNDPVLAPYELSDPQDNMAQYEQEGP